MEERIERMMEQMQQIIGLVEDCQALTRAVAEQWATTYIPPEPAAVEKPAAEEADPKADEAAKIASHSIFGSFAPGATAQTAGVDDEEPSDVAPVDKGEDEAEAEVEEDTEAFLEKVFSELDSPEDADEDEEGYGLLRRRRLGALKDSSGDA